MMKDAIEHRSSFNLIHYETAFKVDIFIRKARAFDQMRTISWSRIGKTSHARAGKESQGFRISQPGPPCFEDNPIAKALYTSLGYEVQSSNMRKRQLYAPPNFLEFA